MKETRSFLTFIENHGDDGHGHKLAKYKCICGVEKILSISRVNSLHTKSCGCMMRFLVSKNRSTHALSKHPLFLVWNNMKRRCYDTKSKSYISYGAKGVRVCQEWMDDFKVFYDWCLANGWQKGLEIDKDIKAKEAGVQPLLYSPEMCCFVTSRVNNNNRVDNKFIEFNGDKLTIAQWARKCNLTPSALNSRITSGWDISAALNTPLKISKNNSYGIRYSFGYIG